MIFLLDNNFVASIFYIPGDGDGLGDGLGLGEGEGLGLGLGDSDGEGDGDGGSGKLIPSSDFKKGESNTTFISESVDVHSPTAGQLTPDFPSIALKEIGSPPAALDFNCCWVWTSLIPKGMATIIMAKIKNEMMFFLEKRLLSEE